MQVRSRLWLHHNLLLSIPRQTMTDAIRTPLSLSFGLVLGLSLFACTTNPASSPPADPALRSAVKAPMVDINLLHKKIPKVLETARNAPYSTPGDHQCNQLADEVSELSQALGDDLDAPGSRGRNSVSTGSAVAFATTTGAMEEFATGWLPDRAWVRRLTVAERDSRTVASAVRAGLVRRAFLKGIGEQSHCAFPASPLVPVTAASWRFTHAQPAPWDPENPLGPDLRGEVIHISNHAFRGPSYLNCEPAEFTRLKLPAEGLFEGGLPAPAEKSGQTVGLAHFPVATTRVACANASFDLHQIDAQTLLIGLDNRVWTLSHTAGTDSATSADGKPAGRVQLLLETHFSGDMGFLPETAQAKSRFFSAELNKAIARYFAVQRPPDEVPPINGDPFTDSQEYPTRFAVSEGNGDDVRASVEVVFASGWSTYPLVYRLVHDADGWKLDDIVYPGGYTFRNLLTML